MSSIKERQSVITFVKPSQKHEILRPTSKRPLVCEDADKQSANEHETAAGVRAPYDLNIVNDILAKSNRYKNLKPTVTFEILTEKHEYENLKTFAISHLEADLRKQFAIFSLLVENMEKAAKPSDELFHNIFSWNWNDFVARRKLRNFVWVGVLLKMDASRLHVYKFQKDLGELKLFLEKIFDGLYSCIGVDSIIDIYQHVEQPIDASKKALHTINSIDNEVHVNNEELKNLINKEQFFMSAKRISEDKLLKVHLENRIWDNHIREPIEVRYQSNWFRNIVEQNQYQTDRVVQKYESDMLHHRQILNLETFVNNNFMDYCYSSIEVYKNCMVKVEEKFDKELDEIESKLTYLRLQTDKLREQRKWLSVEIERFHEKEMDRQELHSHTYTSI